MGISWNLQQRRATKIVYKSFVIDRGRHEDDFESLVML